MATPQRFALWIVLALAAACGPGRTTYARYPGAPAAFDRASSNQQAVEVADKVLAAAGGAAAWDKAKQIRWSQARAGEGGATIQGEQAWDRWNARHWARAETPDGAAVVAYAIYGDYATAYLESKNGTKQIIDGQGKGTAVGTLKTAFQQDVTVMFMSFLLEEPGAKLEYVGPVKDGETEYHDLKILFPDDPLRKEYVYHAIVDKNTNVIRRVSIEKGVEKIGFELSDWTDVNGIKVPATRKNLGSSELSQSKGIRVGDVEDDLYMTPLK